MFFNLTNVPEVEQGGTPVYDEKGPYCYNTYKEKINIEWNEDQTEVTHQTYLYVPARGADAIDADCCPGTTHTHRMHHSLMTPTT